MPLSDSAPNIVVVDDDESQRLLLQRWLEHDGATVHTFPTGESFLRGLARTLPDAVCLDLLMPGIGGLETLRRLREHHPRLPVLILSSEDGVQAVVTAMQLGAYDYLIKPIDRTRLVTSLRNAVERHRMAVTISQLSREVEGTARQGFIAASPQMRALFRQIDRLSPADVSVLIRGESGTGKELVARALHDGGARKTGAFVAVNCAAIPAALIESELFGHERGAFTGATQRRIGRIEQADGGTLFLDEIGELGADLQAKLLRVLQEGTFHRVGADRETRSDFRLLTATHRDLRADVVDGRFREDLYFRIAVFELDVPPLRDREGDILLLAEAFAQRYGEQHRGQPARLRPETASLISEYRWPGNVRELQNAIQRAVVSAEGTELHPGDLPAQLRQATTSTPALSPATAARDSMPTSSLELSALERWAIATALERTGRNLAESARLLGIGRSTLYRKIKEYALADDEAWEGTRHPS